MDKDRIVGSANDIGGKLEGAVGDATGDAKTQASGLAREATGTAQDLYGQRRRDQLCQGCLREQRDSPSGFGSRCAKGATESIGLAARRGLYRFCACAADDTPAAPAAATAARLPLAERA
jgi:uncharacterized protein YjbJ (UPF0337 family)